jgi:hypothetical protein
METPEAWGDWVHSFRERFIAAQGWDAKEARRRIRDAWVGVRDGRVHVLADGVLPAGAVPVFQCSPLVVKLPIRIRTPHGSGYEGDERSLASIS